MITKNDTIQEILKKREGAGEILMGFGMGCIGCPSAASEILEQACEIHGINLDEVLSKLNEK